MQHFIWSFRSKPRLPIDYGDLKPKKSNFKQFKWRKIGPILCMIILFVYIILGGKYFSSSEADPAGSKSKTDSVTFRENMGQKSTQVLINNNQNAGVQLKNGNEMSDLPKNEDDLPDSVHIYDLGKSQGKIKAEQNEQRVLLLIPLRNCENMLPLMFRNMMNMTYDHSLIDVAFLVSDCTKGDRTLEMLYKYSIALQEKELLPMLEEHDNRVTSKGFYGTTDLYTRYMPEDYIKKVKNAFSPPYHEGYTKPFHNIEIYQKDFGQSIGQGFSDRHDVKIQGIRRKLMGRSRNWLLSVALRPYHSWVYWRDVDIELCPGDVLQFMMKFAKNFDIMIPNVWRPLPTFLGNEQPYDLNSWIESDEALKLAKTLDEDDVIVEGYAEYPTWRAHLAYIRDPNGNPNEIVSLDGVGGVSILAKAEVFRRGANFPAFTFLNHAETEAFGKMSKQMGFKIAGLPHYTIWHIYEPSQEDLQKISQMERKKRRFGKYNDN